MPVSISLPLRERPFSAAVTAAFFEGLLPEGFTRRTVAQWMHVDEADYLPILHGLGRECLGALCITEDGDSMDAAYEPIDNERVHELAAEGASRSAELVTNAHLSLTGASGKAGLYLEPNTGQWYLPLGLAPSTHIVKQSHIRFDNIVLNEQLAQMTAAKCGIRVPKSFIINTGKGGEDDVLLATERYDRVMDPAAGEIDGLPKPYRLHQEDFAQVMGIPAYMKYEQSDDGFLTRMFDVLREYSSDPIKDELRLWDTIAFDYLVGNTDAHLKNFSLLYSPDLKSMRLSPAYDIVSTAVYEQSTRELAIRIGGASTIDEVGREDFARAAVDAGLGEKMAMRRFDSVRSKFRRAIHEAAEELTEAGFVNALSMEERILKNGGIARCE